MKTPVGDNLFQESGHTASCGKVSRKSAKGPRKIGGRKKNKKNITYDQNITVFAITIAIAGDCNQLRCNTGKSGPMNLLLAGNDAVPFSLWRGGRNVPCSECRLVTTL